MPGTSGDEDSDTGPFSAPACPGHRGHFGGGKPPPPTVTLMQHAGPLTCIERKAPCHRTVRQGVGAEEKAVSGGGIEGDIGEGLLGLWRNFVKCDVVQVFGKGDDGGW